MKWLLLRGLSREQRHWGRFLVKFREAFGADNVFCLDHVGVGTESHRTPVYSIDAMTADLRRRWLELRGAGTEPWGIVSLSMGSMVSLDWCAKFPEDFAEQVIMNVSSSTDSLPWNRLLLTNAGTFASLAKATDGAARERAVLDLCTNLLNHGQKEKLAAEWASFALPKPQLRKVALTQLWASATFRRPKSLSVPSLALVSAADRLVHPSCTSDIATALKIPLEVHPAAGHELCLDDPDWVIDRVKDFKRREA